MYDGDHHEGLDYEPDSSLCVGLVVLALFFTAIVPCRIYQAVFER